MPTNTTGEDWYARSKVTSDTRLERLKCNKPGASEHHEGRESAASTAPSNTIREDRYARSKRIRRPQPPSLATQVMSPGPGMLGIRRADAVDHVGWPDPHRPSRSSAGGSVGFDCKGMRVGAVPPGTVSAQCC